MSKYICPTCHKEYDDDYSICHQCGARLVDNADTNPKLNMEDTTITNGDVSIDQPENAKSTSVILKDNKKIEEL